MLILLPISCAELPERPTQEDDGGAFETLPDISSIPAEWGELEAVSSSADGGDVFQLWFQDEAGTIRVAFYNSRTNELQKDGRIIPRSGGPVTSGEEEGS